MSQFDDAIWFKTTYTMICAEHTCHGLLSVLACAEVFNSIHLYTIDHWSPNTKALCNFT